jgi:hypothetical protein
VEQAIWPRSWRVAGTALTAQRYHSACLAVLNGCDQLT